MEQTLTEVKDRLKRMKTYDSRMNKYGHYSYHPDNSKLAGKQPNEASIAVDTDAVDTDAAAAVDTNEDKAQKRREYQLKWVQAKRASARLTTQGHAPNDAPAPNEEA